MGIISSKELHTHIDTHAHKTDNLIGKTEITTIWVYVKKTFIWISKKSLALINISI